MNADQKAAVRYRAEQAIEDLYHNATLPLMPDLYGHSEDFAQSWLQDACQFEIEYLRDGGSTPGDYRATLAHPANAGRYKSARAREYYIRKGMRDRDLERADCGALTGWRVLALAERRARGQSVGQQLKRWHLPANAARHDAQWERIGEYGTLYQWGRGGRTLAPDGLVRMRGGSSFSLAADCSERSIASCIELIRIVESFNRYVSAWCASVPEQWREYCANLRREQRAERKLRKQTKGRA